MFGLLFIVAFFRTRQFYQAETVVTNGRGFYRAEGWTEVMVKGINRKTVSLQVGGRNVVFSGGKAYVNENMELMVPESVLSDAFSCAVNLYDGERLLLERNTVRLELYVQKAEMKKNGELVSLSSPPEYRDGELYVPIRDIGEGFGYEYTWSMEENMGSLTADEVTEAILPYAYDYRKVGRAPEIRDQGKFGTCWAFATLGALETALLPEESYDFSEDHISMNNGFKVRQNDGGDYTMSMAYLASWRGPVLESQDPYGDGESPEDLLPAKHIQEIQILSSKDYAAIKKAVYLYGGVQTSLYMSLATADSRSQYYNRSNAAYCYIGSKKANHDVVIVGWDDNYSRDNFNAQLEGDGAFLCRNSWGNRFGDGGYFYVSYYDTNIGIHNLVYTRIEEKDNYDMIYQSDLCGWVGQLGYERESACFANAYTARDGEYLRAVSFYATGADTEYEIYFVPSMEEKGDLSKGIFVCSGKFSNAGYYTVDLPQSFILEAGQKFAVMVKITTPGSVRPIAAEYAADESRSTVDLSDGEGYISSKGTVWTNVEESQQCNLCLKVFTDLREDTKYGN